MKRRRFLIIGILISILMITKSVSAKEMDLYFYPNGGNVSTSGFAVGDYGYINYNDSFYASYTEKSTIKNINSISGKAFVLTKNGTSLVKGREWYFTNYYDGKTYYISQSKSYNVNEIFKSLQIEDDFVSFDVYANWENKKQTGGVDLLGSSTPKTEKATSFTITANKTTITEGQSITLKTTFKPSGAPTEAITWTSSNTKVATINKSGKVTGVGAGKVTITGKSKNGLKSTITLTITSKEKPVHYVKIQYNINSGTLLPTHGKDISVRSGKIYMNNSYNIQEIPYGKSMGKDGLANYNNKYYVNISRANYIITPKYEWNTKPDGTGKSYNQNTIYKASDFCNASKSDCTVTLYANWKKAPKDKIHFINIRRSNSDDPLSGQGDAILLESKGKYAMIDTGLNGGKEVVYNYLKSQGVNELEFLVLTHNHHDHNGSAVYLDQKIKIKKVYMKHYLGNDKGNLNIEDAKNRQNNIANQFGSRIVYVDTNSKYKESSKNSEMVTLNNMKVYFYNTAQRLKTNPSHSIREYTDFWSESYFSNDENVNSIVNLVNVNNHNILLTGDLDSYKVLNGLFQKRIVGKIKKLDLLKIPHHAVENCAGGWIAKDQKTPWYLPVEAENYVVTNSSTVATITADYSFRKELRNSCYNNLFNNNKTKAKKALCKSYFSQDSKKAVVFDYTKAGKVQITGGGQGKASICK